MCEDFNLEVWWLTIRDVSEVVLIFNLSELTGNAIVLWYFLQKLMGDNRALQKHYALRQILSNLLDSNNRLLRACCLFRVSVIYYHVER